MHRSRQRIHKPALSASEAIRYLVRFRQHSLAGLKRHWDTHVLNDEGPAAQPTNLGTVTPVTQCTVSCPAHNGRLPSPSHTVTVPVNMDSTTILTDSTLEGLRDPTTNSMALQVATLNDTANWKVGGSRHRSDAISVAPLLLQERLVCFTMAHPLPSPSPTFGNAAVDVWSNVGQRFAGLSPLVRNLVFTVHKELHELMDK